MFSWLWRCSSPQDWPSRPTAVGANAPSANRANVRPAIAGAEPELAYWGVYPPGCTPLFLPSKASSGGECLCQRRGKFFCRPALREQKLKSICILIFCQSSRNLPICSIRCRAECSLGWGSRGHLRGNIRCSVFCTSLRTLRRGKRGAEWGGVKVSELISCPEGKRT